MVDTSPETKVIKVAEISPDLAPPPIDTGAWNPRTAPAVDTTVKPVPAQFARDVQIGGLDPGADTGRAPAARAANTTAASAKALDKPMPLPKFDSVAAAADLNDALHPAFWSTRLGPDGERVWNKLLNMTPDEYKAVDKEFTQRFGQSDRPWFSGDKPWTLADDIKQNLSSSDADRLSRLIESKGHNDVPPEHRVSGEQLLKPGSTLKVGEINPVTLPDGRRYDVYVPKNADDRAPVIVAMDGVVPGDSVGLIAKESGLTADAERTGATIVFAYPKPRSFDVGLTSVTGVAWNAPGRTNLPSAPDNVTDDRKYLDNVLDDLGTKTRTAEKVGLFGFSDGGRFAQVYAADRPDRVAAVVSEDGTWMYGDKKPTAGKPIMIVHGDADQTLPYNGGMGSVSRKMDWLLGTHIDKSAPYMQAEVWKDADKCDGPVQTETDGEVVTHDYTGCKVGEVKEYILKGGHHALNDYKNDGNRFMQWLLGSADRRQDFATQGAEFLTRHIVSDPSMEQPQ